MMSAAKGSNATTHLFPIEVMTPWRPNLSTVSYIHHATLPSLRCRVFHGLDESWAEARQGDRSPSSARVLGGRIAAISKH